jgi:hypothetical protein
VAFGRRRAGRGLPCAPLTPLSSGRDSRLEGLVLGLPGPIDEQSAEQARTGADAGVEPGIAADRANYRAAAGAMAVPVNARCWVGVISAQAATGRATAASSSNLFMAFPRAV